MVSGRQTLIIASFILLSAVTTSAGINQWSCIGQISNQADNHVVTTMVISPDGKTITVGTTSDSVCDYTHTPPTVTTSSATDIALNSATLHGSVNANNANSSVLIEYGTSDSYGSTTLPNSTLVTGATVLNISSVLSGLIPETTYHYRVVAVNSGGTSYGNDVTFTTPQPSLSVTTAGNGTGQIATGSSGILCNTDGSGDCISSFHYGNTITLSATTSPDTAFIGWLGACSDVAPCPLAMTTNYNVTGQFVLGAKARVNSTGYLSFGDAYSAAPINPSILIIDGTHALGELVMKHGKDVTLLGGYDSKFEQTTGVKTVLQGTLSIQNGSLRVNGISIK